MEVLVILPISHADKLNFFKPAVDSVLNQSFSSFKLVACPDGPVDSEILDYLEGKEDDRIIVDASSQNMGLAATLNRILKKFPADIYFRMDADDVSLPERFQKTICKFKENPSLKLIGTDCIEVDEQDNELFYKKMPADFPSIEKWIFKRNPFVHPSVAFKKEFVDEVGYYNPAFRKGQDFELWARAVVLGVEMANINEALLRFRIKDEMWKNRSSWHAIRNEINVVIYLIRKKRAYKHLVKGVFGKLFIRIVFKLSPASVNKWLFNVLRN